MRLRRIFSGVATLLLLVGWASSAGAQTQVDNRVWFIMPMQGRIGSSTSPWRWVFETILRSREGLDELDTSGLRPYVTFDVTPRLSIGGGYAWANAYPVSGGTTTEHRIFGQFSWSLPVIGGTLALRTRMETRLVEDNSGPAGRFRQQFRFSHPIKRGHRLAILGYDELFVHTNETSRADDGIEQNRIFVGVSDTLTKRLRLEIGYLNQFYPSHRGAAARMNHVLSTVLGLTF